MTAIYALDKELQNAITTISKEDPKYNDMIVLSYLGNSAEDAVIFLASLSKKNDPTIGSIVQVTSESKERKSPVAFVFVVGVPLFLAMILSMYVVRRHSSGKN